MQQEGKEDESDRDYFKSGIKACIKEGLNFSRGFNCEVVEVDMDTNGINISQLELEISKIKNSGKTIKFIYTIPDFHNPTGYLTSDDPLYFVILLNQKKNHREKIRDILISTDFSNF